MNDVLFTSDLHFGHEKILWLGNGRPFDTVDEMNETMIERWNDRVHKSDRVYFLGDLSFASKAIIRETIPRLRGQIHVVRGNHDGGLKGLHDMFTSFQDYKEITISGQRIILFHFPMVEWHQSHHGSWHLHGHQHGNGAPTTLPRIDVGVDCFNFRPVSFSEIAEIMKDREWEPQSHH